MAYIYKITNLINNKVYIGKTLKIIQERWKEHCKDYLKRDKENRPLYSAMKKYGINNFMIEEVEQCSDEEASEKEIYWIGRYDSYNNGYNATLGGDGKLRLNHQEIINELKRNPYPSQVAQKFNCSSDWICELAKSNNILVKNLGQESNVNTKKLIAQYDKENNYIQTFNSVTEAAQWCFEHKLCKTLNSGVRGHIGDAANGKRKTAYQHIWKYI